MLPSVTATTDALNVSGKATIGGTLTIAAGNLITIGKGTAADPSTIDGAIVKATNAATLGGGGYVVLGTAPTGAGVLTITNTGGVKLNGDYAASDTGVLLVTAGKFILADGKKLTLTGSGTVVIGTEITLTVGIYEADGDVTFDGTAKSITTAATAGKGLWAYKTDKDDALKLKTQSATASVFTVTPSTTTGATDVTFTLATDGMTIIIAYDSSAGAGLGLSTAAEVAIIDSGSKGSGIVLKGNGSSGGDADTNGKISLAVGARISGFAQSTADIAAVGTIETNGVPATPANVSFVKAVSGTSNDGYLVGKTAVVNITNTYASADVTITKAAAIVSN